MKWKISLLFMVILLCCAGCASMSQTTDDYVAGIETAKENAIKIATISEFQTCFVRACLGSHIDQVPCEMVKTLDEIDQLMKGIKDFNLMDDCQKGKILGLWTRLVTLGILEIVEAINPGVLGKLL